MPRLLSILFLLTLTIPFALAKENYPSYNQPTSAGYSLRDKPTEQTRKNIVFLSIVHSIVSCAIIFIIFAASMFLFFVKNHKSTQQLSAQEQGRKATKFLLVSACISTALYTLINIPLSYLMFGPSQEENPENLQGKATCR